MMKICTIGYDGDDAVALPGRAVPDARTEILRQTFMNAIRRAVDTLAKNNNLDPDTYIWSHEAGSNPVSLKLACDEEMANLLRYHLPDEFLIEVDPAPCHRVIQHAAHLHIG